MFFYLGSHSWEPKDFKMEDNNFELRQIGLDDVCCNKKILVFN